MLTTSRSTALVLFLAGCGGATEATTGGASGSGAVPALTESATTGGIRGTHSPTDAVGAGPGTRAAGGAQATATAKGGTGTNTSGPASGGALSTGASSATAGNVSRGGTSTGASSLSSGGTTASRTRGAGGFNANQGGAATAGASNYGGSAGGAGECIDVCSRYGSPCCMWQTSCIRPHGGCTFDVLAASVGTTYDYADLESKVAALQEDVSASFTDQDIAWAAADPWPAPRVEMHLTDDAATRYGAVLDAAKDGRVFRVSCGGQTLFVGVFYLIYGAAALNTPVAHQARENGILVLRLGAVQGAWVMTPSTGKCTTPCQRIDRIELRAAFCWRGIMHELDPDAKPANW